MWKMHFNKLIPCYSLLNWYIGVKVLLNWHSVKMNWCKQRCDVTIKTGNILFLFLNHVLSSLLLLACLLLRHPAHLPHPTQRGNSVLSSSCGVQHCTFPTTSEHGFPSVAYVWDVIYKYQHDAVYFSLQTVLQKKIWSFGIYFTIVLAISNFVLS